MNFKRADIFNKVFRDLVIPMGKRRRSVWAESEISEIFAYSEFVFTEA